MLSLFRVTRKLNKNLANIWKCSPNCSQSIPAQIESPKHLHSSPFDCQNKCNKPCFEAACLAENVNIAQAKSSQTAKFHPIWSHCFRLRSGRYLDIDEKVLLLYDSSAAADDCHNSLTFETAPPGINLGPML
jgi:hypothetical protein